MGHSVPEARLQREVCDYIAGMTDGYRSLSISACSACRLEELEGWSPIARLSDQWIEQVKTAWTL